MYGLTSDEREVCEALDAMWGKPGEAGGVLVELGRRIRASSGSRRCLKAKKMSRDRALLLSKTVDVYPSFDNHFI